MAMSMTQRLRYEGRLEGQQRFILSVLTRRFRTVPASICEKIQDIHDEVVLESLLITAMECQSLEEFQDSLL